MLTPRSWITGDDYLKLAKGFEISDDFRGSDAAFYNRIYYNSKKMNHE